MQKDQLASINAYKPRPLTYAPAGLPWRCTCAHSSWCPCRHKSMLGWPLPLLPASGKRGHLHSPSTSRWQSTAVSTCPVRCQCGPISARTIALREASHPEREEALEDVSEEAGILPPPPPIDTAQTRICPCLIMLNRAIAYTRGYQMIKTNHVMWQKNQTVVLLIRTHRFVDSELGDLSGSTVKSR